MSFISSLLEKIIYYYMRVLLEYIISKRINPKTINPRITGK